MTPSPDDQTVISGTIRVRRRRHKKSLWRRVKHRLKKNSIKSWSFFLAIVLSILVALYVIPSMIDYFSLVD